MNFKITTERLANIYGVVYGGRSDRTVLATAARMMDEARRNGTLERLETERKVTLEERSKTSVKKIEGLT